MAYRIAWTNEARIQRKEIMTYGRIQFGAIVARKFRESLKAQSLLLMDNPNLGKAEPLLVNCTKEYRSLVVHKHYKLIYFINELNKTVYVVDVWDTRREPGSLSNRIK